MLALLKITARWYFRVLEAVSGTDLPVKCVVTVYPADEPISALGKKTRLAEEFWFHLPTMRMSRLLQKAAGYPERLPWEIRFTYVTWERPYVLTNGETIPGPLAVSLPTRTGYQ